MKKNKKSDFNLTHQNLSIESKIVASLEKIAQSFRVLLWQESKSHALTPIQIQVLIFLMHHSEDKRKVSYLADEFNMTKATISDTIKILEQKGLIYREYIQHDTRSFMIHLTEKGIEITKQTSLFSQEIRKPIDEISKEEKEIMLNNLLNIIRHLNATGVITIQRMCLTCSFYKSSKNNGTHFCNLLNQTLITNDLRIDCPEHELKV